MNFADFADSILAGAEYIDPRARNYRQALVYGRSALRRARDLYDELHPSSNANVRALVRRALTYDYASSSSVGRGSLRGIIHAGSSSKRYARSWRSPLYRKATYRRRQRRF